MKKTASIVSIGSWNPRIFTPDWVSANVFSMPEGDSMNISLNEKQMNFSYIWKDIQLLIVDRGIELMTEAVSLDSLKLMEQIYRRLSDVLPYTPVTAVGFNLNLLLTKDEFVKTAVSSVISPQNIGDYSNRSQTFSSNKDGVIRSFDVRNSNDSIEIRSNFHFANPQSIADAPSVFEMIISEFKHFLGYELSL